MFKITERKGFHITFPNGWTVSVQFGPGSYCENKSYRFDQERKIGAKGSADAEVWAWNGTERYPKNPLGWQTPAQVLAFMNEVAKR